MAGRCPRSGRRARLRRRAVRALVVAVLGAGLWSAGQAAASAGVTPGNPLAVSVSAAVTVPDDVLRVLGATRSPAAPPSAPPQPAVRHLAGAGDPLDTDGGRQISTGADARTVLGVAVGSLLLGTGAALASRRPGRTR